MRFWQFTGSVYHDICANKVPTRTFVAFHIHLVSDILRICLTESINADSRQETADSTDNLRRTFVEVFVVNEIYQKLHLQKITFGPSCDVQQVECYFLFPFPALLWDKVENLGRNSSCQNIHRKIKPTRDLHSSCFFNIHNRKSKTQI